MNNIIETIQILSALSDNNRCKIIKELLSRDYCVGGLARKLDITEAAVSQHLKILKDAGLINGEKRGYFRHYKVNKESLKFAADTLLKLSETPRERERLCPPENKEDCILCKGKINKQKTINNKK